MSELSKHIEELQTKIAFQEDVIESLNDALVEQQRQIHELQFQMKHVVDKMKSISASPVASESEETPPPHY
ncbi:SlyX family protein [Paraneptunicella aestuarii]|uniref:SlyX family protein n=1 Tax=Paraneptunicella aestuarii TaxID=2831148 RepID=UPI001E2AC402|nr:SlyX family protein [Paraneptunicella aestuarii]UAA38894.1 SlyX family protein [Paraneptunicella aestuarii]